MPDNLHTHDVHSLNAHPATTDLKPLPLPPLQQTLDEYRTALSAVLSEEELAHATRVIEGFAQGKGPLLDAALQDRAATREEEGTNWLHDEWYEGYLEVREPLQLSTNVGFQLAPFGSEFTGTRRVAEAVQRIATVHLQVAADAVPEDVDARGNRITMNQWFTYNGGLRHPQMDVDDVAVSERDAAHREIGIFIDERFFAVPISDADGNVAPLEQLAATFDELLDTATRTDAPSPLDFNAASLIGSGPLGDALSGFFETNSATYERLSDMLFTVDLIRTDGRDDANLLADVAFRPRGAWTYKPLSYQFGIDSEWSALHVEHTCQDGATLVTALTRMHSAEVQESTIFTELSAEEMRWEYTRDLERDVRSYAKISAEDATPYAAEIVTVDLDQPAVLPFKFSRDASAQLIMTIAQQLTYGRVRAVYEAVDMREYRAGRTECLRAATPEAVGFARDLVDGSATEAQLTAAIDAHRAWVKRCKSGNGFDRHIQMLQHLDTELPPAEFFYDEATISAREDFLSTTSIGGADQIVRYSFAPTLPEGFGVAYTPLPQATEYCVSYNAQTAEQPEEFLRNLTRASELLWKFCAEL